jgi:hypothetical protein
MNAPREAVPIFSIMNIHNTHDITCQLIDFDSLFRTKQMRVALLSERYADWRLFRDGQDAQSVSLPALIPKIVHCGCHDD